MTLMTGAIATSVLAMCRARGQERPFCLYEVIEMDKQNLRVVTVTMFGPRVPEQSVFSTEGGSTSSCWGTTRKGLMG